jgi:hypothetical protein
VGIPSLDDQFRQRMQRRLDRATRRFQKMRPLLLKGEESDPARAAAEALAVEDDFAHIISEMKNVIYDFSVWCRATGKPGQGYREMDGWRDDKLSGDDRDTWSLIRHVRDYDVHREPISPQRQPKVIHFNFMNIISFDMRFNPYIAGFQLEDGSARAVEVEPFCRVALALLQRFVGEFDRL